MAGYALGRRESNTKAGHSAFSRAHRVHRHPISPPALHPRLQASAPPRLRSYCSLTICCWELSRVGSGLVLDWSALGCLRAGVGGGGRSCMRPGRVMGSFGCFNSDRAWDGEARILCSNQAGPKPSCMAAQSRNCIVRLLKLIPYYCRSWY